MGESILKFQWAVISWLRVKLRSIMEFNGGAYRVGALKAPARGQRNIAHT